MRRTPRAAPGPPRGVLHQAAPDGVVEHRRLLPSPALAGSVAHFWWIRWSLRTPFLVETLPHPTVHWVVESPPGRGEITGVPTHRFSRTLAGEGRVVGIKFRPGAFRPWIPHALARLRGQVLPIEALLGVDGAGLVGAVHSATTFEAAIERAEAWLVERAPPLPAELCQLRDLVERIAVDREILRVETAAALVELLPRTLERRFADLIGTTPKWVIRRYRLIEAAERLRQQPGLSIAELAASLAYFDQAHFSREFKAVVGRTPRDYQSAGARALSAPR